MNAASDYYKLECEIRQLKDKLEKIDKLIMNGSEYSELWMVRPELKEILDQ